MRFRRVTPIEPRKDGETSDVGAAVTIVVDGVTREARGGEPLAAALLSLGVQNFRLNPVSGAPRAPYCMMGTCFECSLTVDGEANRQACLVAVRAGMVVETGRGARGIEP